MLRGVRAAVLVAVLGSLTFGLLVQPAGAETTWSGVCTYEGWSQFWPYRKWIPQPSGYHYRGKGTCEGKLNGKPYKGRSTVDNYANMKQPMSCAIGGSTYGGPVYLTFVDAKPPRRTRKPRRKPPKGYRDKPGKHVSSGGKKRHRTHRRRHRQRHHKRVMTKRYASAPQDPQQPPPVPPAPNTVYPVLAAWSDEVNIMNDIYSDLWGAYRGFAVGYGGFPDDPNALDKCRGEGVKGGQLKQTYTTLRELHG
jgi:hypothetical protein